MFFIFGTILLIAGMSLAYGATGRQRWVGVAICAVGWFGVVFQEEILSFSENAYASLDFGVSAPCYRGAEDISVTPCYNAIRIRRRTTAEICGFQ
jgi:hypothetical protein